MNKPNASVRETLDLFDEKFEKLKRSEVWNAIEQGEIRFSISAEVGEPVLLTAEGPGEMALDAFVLTLRFFLQNREPISISNLCELIEELPIPEETKERVSTFRAAFNEAMDRPCPIELDGQRPTHRDVLMVFLYGSLAHANNPKRRKTFKAWASHAISLGAMTQAFYLSLLQVANMVAFLNNILQEIRPDLDLDEDPGIPRSSPV